MKSPIRLGCRARDDSSLGRHPQDQRALCQPSCLAKHEPLTRCACILPWGATVVRLALVGMPREQQMPPLFLQRSTDLSSPLSVPPSVFFLSPASLSPFTWVTQDLPVCDTSHLYREAQFWVSELSGQSSSFLRSRAQPGSQLLQGACQHVPNSP